MQGEISKDPHTWPCSQGPPFNPPGSAWFLETSVEGHLSSSGQFRKPGLPRDPAPDTPATCCPRGSLWLKEHLPPLSWSAWWPARPPKVGQPTRVLPHGLLPRAQGAREQAPFLLPSCPPPPPHAPNVANPGRWVFRPLEGRGAHRGEERGAGGPFLSGEGWGPDLTTTRPPGFPEQCFSHTPRFCDCSRCHHKDACPLRRRAQAPDLDCLGKPHPHLRSLHVAMGRWDHICEPLSPLSSTRSRGAESMLAAPLLPSPYPCGPTLGEL